MRTSSVVAAVVALFLSACMTTTTAVCPQCRGQVVYPAYKGRIPAVIPPGGPLPRDPGPGFLYTRVVYGQEDDRAFAYIVHVSERGAQLLAIVGPLRYIDQPEKGEEKRDDYSVFFESLCRAYGKHGPGKGSCCPEHTRGDAAPDSERSGPAKKLALTPIIPAPPPPPWDGSAYVYTVQSGSVNTSDTGLAGQAVGAAGSAYSALNGGS